MGLGGWQPRPRYGAGPPCPHCTSLHTIEMAWYMAARIRAMGARADWIVSDEHGCLNCGTTWEQP